MSLVLSELENVIKLVVDNSFKFKKVNQGFLFSKKINGNIDQQIILTYSGYPNMYMVHPPVVSVNFKIVEENLNLVINDFKSKKVINNVPTLRQSCVGFENVDYNKFTNILTSVNEFEQVGKELRKIIDLCVMPFLKQYDSIENVADLLAKLSPVEISKYIQGSILFPKTLLILKICNHNKFYQKVEEFNKYFESHSESNFHSEVSNICKMIILNEKKLNI